MGQARAEVTGFVMTDPREGFTRRSGKKFFSIAISTGKSEKLENGTYDNTNQVIWNLTAYGDYADKLAAEGIRKGDKLRCTVVEPRPSMYQGKDNKTRLSIEGPIWNHSVSRVIWCPKDAKAADGFTPPAEGEPLPPDADDWEPANYENMQ